MEEIRYQAIKALEHILEHKEQIAYSSKLNVYYLFASEYDLRDDIEVGKMLGDIDKDGTVLFRFSNLNEDKDLYKLIIHRSNCLTVHKFVGNFLSKKEVGKIVEG